jgi:predicted glycoside hydrolase/deacetylase ChbG (UPF0249 family)
MRPALLLLAAVAALLAPASPARAQEEKEPMKDFELIIRTDDIGFCHSVNMAIEKVLEDGHVTSISVMANGPWLNEGVEILKRHPEVSVGVHLALNSEWKEYKWGPVAPVSEVSSLVDAHGKFFGTRQKLMDHRPDPAEVEKELRAQIDLLFRKGLDVSYVDYHMGAAMGCAEFQQVVEKLATEYGIGISRYFGEKDVKSIYSVPPGEKVERVVEYLESIDEPGIHMLVVHPGWDTPEMQAMTDENLSGMTNMSEHRQAEALMLCDPRFKEAVAAKFKLVGYSDLRDRGLHKMKRPFVAKPYAEIVKEQALFNPYEAHETK